MMSERQSRDMGAVSSSPDRAVFESREEAGTAERVREYVRHQIGDTVGTSSVHEEGYGFGDFGATDAILTHLYREHGSVYDPSDYRITPEQREFVAEYVKALLDEFQERSLQAKTQEEHEQLVAVSHRFREQVLSVSPNIFNRLDVGEMLLATARASRIPEITQSIGYNLRGEFVYTFNFEDIDQQVLETLEVADAPEQIDVVLLFRNLAMNAANQGWADETVRRLFDLAQAVVNDERKHPLVRYAAELSLAYIGETFEFMDSTQLPSWMSESSERKLEEGDAYWRDHLVVESDHFLSQGRLVRVAKDALGTMSDSGVLRALECGDWDGVQELPEDVQSWHRWEENLEHASNNRDRVSALSILLAMERDDHAEIRALADGWMNERLPGTHKKDWEALRKLVGRYDGMIAEANAYRQRRQEEAEEANMFASVQARDRITRIIEELPHPLPESLEGLVGDMQGRRTDEETMNDLDAIVHWFTYAQERRHDLRVSAREVRNAWDGLHETYDREWKAYRDDVETHHGKIVGSLDELGHRIDTLAQPLEDHREEMVAVFAKTAQERMERASKNAKTYQPEPLLEAIPRLMASTKRTSRVDVALLFSDMHHPDILDRFERDYGVDVRDMTLREQVSFLDFLGRADTTGMAELQHLTREYGVDAARSFLSAEFGDEFHGYIFEIGEVLEKPVAERVFAAYAKIAELAQTEATALLDEFFVEGKGTPVDSAKIEMELLKRAKRVIEDFAKEAMVAKAAGKKPDSATLLKKLEQANADTVLFTSIFKAAFKGKKGVEFEAIRGVEFGERAPESFSDAEREEMLEIFNENWADQNQLAAESFRGDLTRGFDPKNKDTLFYMTKKDGKMVGFIRFDKRDDLEPGAYYAGSLNIRSEYRGSAVGEAVLEKTLQHEAESHTIYAHVVADAVVGTHYVESGLIVTGVKWIEKNGERVAELAIREDNEKNGRYRARREGITHEKLLMGVPGVEVRSFDYATEKENFLKAIEEVSQAGKVITRYWIDPNDKNRRYIALESEVSLEPEVVPESASEAA